MLKLRTEHLEVKRVDAVVEDDAVRIADREAGDGVGFAADLDRRVYKLNFVGQRGE